MKESAIHRTLFSGMDGWGTSDPKEAERAWTWESGKRCLNHLGQFSAVGTWKRVFTSLLIRTGNWYSSRCRLVWNLKGTRSQRLFFQIQPLMMLEDAESSGLWPTPTSVQRDHPERVKGLLESGGESFNSRKNGDLRPNSVLDAAMFYGLIPVPESKEELNSDSLNVEFVGEMMGFPARWTELPFQSEPIQINQSKC